MASKKYWQILKEIPTAVIPKNLVDPKMYTGGREEGHMNKTIQHRVTNLARKISCQHPSYTFWFKLMRLSICNSKGYLQQKVV